MNDHRVIDFQSLRLHTNTQLLTDYGGFTHVKLRYGLLFCLSACVLTAAPVSIFGTGLDSNGQLLADGAVDTHYQLLVSPSVQYPGPNAVVADTQIHPVDNWISTGMTSKWISIRFDAATFNPTGTYVYRTTFDLTGFDLSTVLLTGQFATDDPGSILLNNVSTGINGCCYHQWTPFTISSGLVDGLNTLDFVVQNSGGGPTGIRVDLAGNGDLNAVPEPGSWILMSAGGVLLGLLTRSNRLRTLRS